MNKTQKFLSGKMHCLIKVHGQLSDDWSDYFYNLELSCEEDEVTCLSGVVEDQSALHGILAKIRNLGLPLLSVECKDVNSMKQ